VAIVFEETPAVGKKKQAVSKNRAPSLSFEESLAELEAIVTRLEGGKLGLADSLAAYQQGVARLQQCYSSLEQAELKIAQVSRVDENGRPVLTSLDDLEGDEDLGTKADARSRRRTAGSTKSPSAPNRSAQDSALF
jgi:exodeoxyribonuclease VII small subunit